MTMPRLLTSLSLLAVGFSSTNALAAGDLPQRMTAKQAATYFQALRLFLTVDGKTCPVGEQPVSGLTTGGASPDGGTQRVLLTFSKGATVTVSRTWDREAAGPKVRVSIDCSHS